MNELKNSTEHYHWNQVSFFYEGFHRDMVGVGVTHSVFNKSEKSENW